MPQRDARVARRKCHFQGAEARLVNVDARVALTRLHLSQSDHAAFCQAKIPCLYFGVEDFENHHKASDDYATMTHGFYVRAVETMVYAVEEFDRQLDAVIKARGAEPRDR